MRMTELFANGYKNKSTNETLSQFIKRCRRYGDRMSTKQLNNKGVAAKEIKSELDDGLIKYEPDCGATKRDGGYSLTNSGIAKAYKLMRSAE